MITESTRKKNTLRAYSLIIFRFCQEFEEHKLDEIAVDHILDFEDLYPGTPPAVLLMIQGDAWELETGLSPAAKSRLERALEAFRAHLSAPEGEGERLSV